MNRRLATILLVAGACPQLTACGPRAPTSKFACVPESTFALASVRVGEPADSAVARLGLAPTIRPDTVHGADLFFPVTRYAYSDFEITVSEATGRVAELRALTGNVRTPLGLHLGMTRREVESRFPAGALGEPIGDPHDNAVEAYACGSLVASTVWLAFDSRGTLSDLVLHGFYQNQ